MRSVIISHAKKYPLMRPTDAVKLIYQATFGGGHMIKDEQTALEYIRREYASCTHRSEPLRCESLGDTSRVYIDGELDDEQLVLVAKMFCESAKLYDVGFDKASKAVKKEFLSRLDVLRALCRDGYFSFTETDLQAYLNEYAAAGYPPVHHSEAYRDAYRPAYRVIDSRYVPLLPCIQKITSLVTRSCEQVVVAIDGRCTSGKTTAAELISKLFDAEVIHMDDFFLPPELRTPERLAEIGGNIHYERFLDEVLPNLRADRPFSHRAFDCQSFTYSIEPRTLRPSRVIIVEGVYSLHKAFGEYFDLSVFMDISTEVQLTRIKRRGDETVLSRFQNEWIPMEQRYFESFGIKQKCDLTI